jgi:hypothetical protein
MWYPRHRQRAGFSTDVFFWTYELPVNQRDLLVGAEIHPLSQRCQLYADIITGVLRIELEKQQK